MTRRIATITSKGQVTIPADVRHRLGLHPGDKIAFEFDDDGERVTIRPARYPSIASLRGAAGRLPQPMSWEEMRRIAREDALAEKAIDPT